MREGWSSNARAHFRLPWNSDQWLFLVSAAIAAVMFVRAYNLVHSRVGRALEAIRDQPIAAVTMGIPTTFHRAAVFGLSTLYVGVAGAMAAMLTQFVSPDSYTLSLSIVAGRRGTGWHCPIVRRCMGCAVHPSGPQCVGACVEVCTGGTLWRAAHPGDSAHARRRCRCASPTSRPLRPLGCASLLRTWSRLQ
ncbi:MAG: branched-chain amino acid ABC transporter permease [Ideonella sp.]|nr:branched-chain amino acid ABC transporter permease [Ideonella sp.]